MEINELVKQDATFTESGFLAKVDNTYIMLLSAIMTENIDRVKHKISIELYEKYSHFIKQLQEQGLHQMYDELNVKTSKIINIEELDDSIKITVNLVARYMDYQLNKETNTCVLGNNTNRIEANKTLIFEKKKGSKLEQAARICPGCGANMDVNNTGKCAYCGTIYNTEDYDYILVDMK